MGMLVSILSSESMAQRLLGVDNNCHIERLVMGCCSEMAIERNVTSASDLGQALDLSQRCIVALP